VIKEIFKEIIIASQERNYDYVFKRDIEFPLISNKIVSFIGVRRSGKTHLMYHTIKELRKKYPVENIVYINFEDDRIFPLELNNLSLFPEAYYELFPEKKSELVFFFFDEIQNIGQWEKFIRRVYDTENCKVFISGSSSKLLSSEIATSLRGRTLSFEIFPLSFKEFLHFNEVKTNFYSPHNKALIVNLLHKYVEFGGFPELVFTDEKFSNKTLQEYIDLIIYKDLIERYNVKNHYLMKYIVKYCFANISTLLSFNKLYNELKSQGIQVSKDTLYNYLHYLGDAFAVFLMPVYSRSLAKQSKNPKKIYAIDVGFKTVSSMGADIGRKYENIVYLQLRQQTKELHYWKESQEVDFIYRENGEYKLINVSYDLSDSKTFDREIKGLLEAMNKLDTGKATLINSEQEKLYTTDDKSIEIVPLWKWLLK